METEAEKYKAISTNRKAAFCKSHSSIYPFTLSHTATEFFSNSFHRAFNDQDYKKK